MEINVAHGILQVLSYFQVFHYPLTRAEIRNYMPVACDDTMLDKALKELRLDKVVYRIDGHYCLLPHPELVKRRKQGNKLGKIKVNKAMRIARFLGMFPFVEAVCISGSLSKDFALPDSDMDFFIVTAPNRMWTARNFMHLFRKLTFLFNAQGMFCMNYYISLQQPEIAPKNMYTAIELATLKPAWVSNNSMEQMNQPNEEWLSSYLPNRQPASIPSSKKNVVAGCIEWILNKAGGNRMENFFYNSTIKRWERKWTKAGYDVEKCMLSVGRHFNTPVNYPVHLPDTIQQKHKEIFREMILKYASVTSASVSL